MSLDRLTDELERIAGPPVDPSPVLDGLLRRHRRGQRLRRAAITAAASLVVVGAAFALRDLYEPSRVDVVDTPGPTTPGEDDGAALELEPLWRANTAADRLLEVELASGSVTLAGQDVVLVASGRLDSSGVIALDARSGDLLWSHPVDRDAGALVLGANDEVALIAVPRGWVAAVEVDTGVERWRLALSNGETPGAIQLTDDVVYFGTAVYDLGSENPSVAYAVDIGDGTVLWRAPFDGAGGLQWGAPALTPELLIWTVAGDRSGEGQEQAYAVDRQTGRIVWAADLAAGAGVYHGSSPLVAEDAVVVWSSSGAVALELSDGSERWRTEGGAMPAALDGRSVWVTTADAAVQLDLRTGHELEQVTGATTVVTGDGPRVFAGESWVMVGTTGARVDVDLGKPGNQTIGTPRRSDPATLLAFEGGLVALDHGTDRVQPVVTSTQFGDTHRFDTAGSTIVLLRADGTVEGFRLSA